MKRTGNLICRIADPDNLRSAFWKAKKRKADKPNVKAFSNDLDNQLLQLRNGILSGHVSVGNYSFFTIHDPKKRMICAADFSERVLHHAIMNVCHSIFEKYQIYHSYASRKGKGTYAAIEQAKRNQRQYPCYIKMDIRKYFDSIDHSVLLAMLQQRIKDKVLLDIFRKIINSYSIQPAKGLPIGSLTSQYFANHYLGKADHYAKEKLQVPAYVRYMDDMVLWGDNKKQLNEKGEAFRDFIIRELDLAFKTSYMNKTSRGLPFCGYTIYPEKILLNGRSKKRFIKKMKTYQKKVELNLWNQKDYQTHILPLLAFAKKANTFGLRKTVIKKMDQPG